VVTTKEWNYKFFDTWSLPMAYVLGFIFADGGIHHSGKGYKIGFYQKNKEYLLGVSKLLGLSESYVKERRDRPGNWSIQVCSKYAFDNLCRLGVVQAKSFVEDVPFPDVPDEFLNTFIMGYFDGDGWASIREYLNKKGKVCRSKSHLGFAGQKVFLEGIKICLTSRFDGCDNKVGQSESGKRCWKYVLSKKSVIRQVRDWMYDQAPLFLMRKRTVLERI